MVVLRRNGEQLEHGILGVVLAEAAEHVAVEHREHQDGAAALGELGQSTNSDGPMSDTITSIFGYLAMSADSTFWVRAGYPVRHLEGLLADELVLVRGVEDTCGGPCSPRCPDCFLSGR